MSGATAAQMSLRRLASSADLGGRLAVEEARDGPERRCPGTGSSPWTCAAAWRRRPLRRFSCGAERDPLQPPVGRRVQLGDRLDVGELVVADLRASRPGAADVAHVLEARGRGHADEQHDDPDVHEVAAVAAPVAPDERDERDGHRLARDRAARAHAAPELLADAADDEARRTRTSAARSRELVGRRARPARRARRARQRRAAEVAAQVRGGRAPPGDHRPDRRRAARAAAPAGR